MTVGHLPREISRFCKFYLEYGGILEAHVSSKKYRRSPLLQGGLEIPITLGVSIGTAPGKIFHKMKELLESTYMEPENIPETSNEKGDVIEII